MTFASRYLSETVAILDALDCSQMDRIAEELRQIRDNEGRLFVIGVGGSAATASHAVNDFRKIAKMESYAPTDNVAELTARTNDEGWDRTFVEWLRTSKMGENDGLLVLSVGGGGGGVSGNIIHAVDYAKTCGTSIFGIVGRNGGYTATRATACCVIPPLYDSHITSHTEGIASVLCHLLVSHPSLTRP